MYYCDSLNNSEFNITGNINNIFIKLCVAGIKNPPVVKLNVNPQKTFDDFFNLKNKCIEKFIFHKNNDLKNFSCIDCYRKTERDNLINLDNNIKHININIHSSPCQCKCIYCQNVYNFNDNEETKKWYNVFFETMLYGIKKQYISKDCMWRLDAGEITIHPYKKEFFNLLKDFKTRYYTNGFIFDNDIANALKNINNELSISIDCGTSLSWEKIKGFNNFDNVKKHISKYIQHCINTQQIHIKYIVLPEYNNNLDDYIGIINFLKENNIKELQIARDIHLRYTKDIKYKNSLLTSVSQLSKICKSSNIYPDIMNKFFSKEEKDYIKIKELN